MEIHFPRRRNSALQNGPTLPPSGRSGHGALPASRGRGRNCRSRWELKDALGRKYKIPPDGKFFLFETSLSGTKFSFFLLLWVFQKKWGSIRILN